MGGSPIKIIPGASAKSDDRVKADGEEGEKRRKKKS